MTDVAIEVPAEVADVARADDADEVDVPLEADEVELEGVSRLSVLQNLEAAEICLPRSGRSSLDGDLGGVLYQPGAVLQSRGRPLASRPRNGG